MCEFSEARQSAKVILGVDATAAEFLPAGRQVLHTFSTQTINVCIIKPAAKKYEA